MAANSGSVRLAAALNQTSGVGRMLDQRHGLQSSAGYLLDDMLGRHHGSLLPARQLRDLIAGDVEPPIRSQQSRVAFRGGGAVGIPVGPAAAFVGNILPGNRDRLV